MDIKNANMKYKALSLLMIVLALASIAYAAVASNSPTSCSGGWGTCTNANANDANRATATPTATTNVTGTWTGYGFGLKDSASITNVTLRADFFASRTSGFATIRVSGDGGANYGPYHVIGGNTVEQTYLRDVTTDVAWTGSKLNSSNLKVEVRCYKVGGGANPTCRLDWIPVNVTYTAFDYSLAASPTSVGANQTQVVSSTFTATSLGGISQPVTLSVSGCPASTTCSLNQSSLTPTGDVLLTVTTTSSTPTGTHVINVTGTGDGITRSSTFTVTVSDSLPVASASATPTSGSEVLTVSFTGGVTGGNGPFTYLWNYSDGSTSTSQNPVHDYTHEGVYVARFTVTDVDGDTSSSTVNITVTNNAPSLTIGANPTSGVDPLTVNFTSAVTGGNAPFTYLWNFSDGSTSTSENPQHVYTSAGSYLARLTVTDNDGDSTTKNVTITVTADTTPVPAPEFLGNGTLIAPANVQFLGIFSAGNSPFTYLWNFGDGGVSTSQFPLYTYNVSGNYTVSFTVTDFDGDVGVGYTNVVIS